MTFPYATNFDAETPGALPIGWANVTGTWVVGATHPVSGAKSLGDAACADGHLVKYDLGTSTRDQRVSFGQYHYGDKKHVQPVLRMNAAGDTFHTFNVEISTNKIQAYRCNAGSFTQVGATVNGAMPTLTTGDLYYTEADATGAAGATVLRLRVWKAGTAKPTTWQIEVTDTSGLAATQYAGLRVGGSADATGAIAADDFAVTDPTVGTVADVCTEDKGDGTAEICWTDQTGITAWNVYQATSLNGAYSLVGTAVTAPYLYATPSSPAYYKVVATVSGSEIPGTMSAAGVKLQPALDSGLSADTIAVPRGTRHNLLVDPATGTRYGATVNNLHFVAISPADQTIGTGPYSPSLVKVDEQFASSLGALSLTTAGSGTAGATGGHLTYSGTATGATWQAAGKHYKAPSLVVGIAFGAAPTGYVRVGIGSARDTGVFAEYSSADATVRVVASTAGTDTVIGTAVSVAAPVGLALEVCNHNYNVWIDTGSGISIVAGGQPTVGGAYDLRSHPEKLAAWVPTLNVITLSGAVALDVTRFRATLFNGVGRGREPSPVTHLDGSYYRTGVDRKTYWVGWDRTSRTSPTTGGDVAAPAAFQAQPYDWTANTWGSPTVQITATYQDGRVGTTQDTKIVYDPDLGGFHVWWNDWALSSQGTGSYTVTLYYQFYTGDLLNPADPEVHFDTPTVVTLPAAIDDGRDAPLYAPSVVRHNGRYYMSGTTSAQGVFYRSALISGAAVDDFDTVIGADTASGLFAGTEEPELMALGSTFEVFGGKMALDGSNHRGLVAAHDTQALTTLAAAVDVDYPNPDTGDTLPQQPAILWGEDDDGNGVVRLIAPDDNFYQSVYQAGGLVTVYEASYKLSGKQFPIRLAFGETAGAGGGGGGAIRLGRPGYPPRLRSSRP